MKVYNLRNIKFSKKAVVLFNYLMEVSKNGIVPVTLTDPQISEATKLSMNTVITQLTKLKDMGFISKETKHCHCGCNRKITINVSKIESLIKLFPENDLKDIMFNDTEVKLIKYLDDATHQGRKIIDLSDAELNEAIECSCAASLRHLDRLGIINRSTTANGIACGSGKSRLIRYNAMKVNSLITMMEMKGA